MLCDCAVHNTCSCSVCTVSMIVQEGSYVCKFLRLYDGKLSLLERERFKIPKDKKWIKKNCCQMLRWHLWCISLRYFNVPVKHLLKKTVNIYIFFYINWYDLPESAVACSSSRYILFLVGIYIVFGLVWLANSDLAFLHHCYITMRLFDNRQAKQVPRCFGNLTGQLEKVSFTQKLWKGLLNWL